MSKKLLGGGKRAEEEGEKKKREGEKERDWKRERGRELEEEEMGEKEGEGEKASETHSVWMCFLIQKNKMWARRVTFRAAHVAFYTSRLYQTLHSEQCKPNS